MPSSSIKQNPLPQIQSLKAISHINDIEGYLDSQGIKPLAIEYEKILPQLLKQMRKNPLYIHCLMNEVASPLCALFLSALGAEPAMTDDPDQVKEMIYHADALYVNLGMANDRRNQAILNASAIAHHQAIPCLIDPVKVDLSPKRLAFCVQTVQSGNWILRCNLNEFKALHTVLRQDDMTNHNMLFIITGTQNYLFYQQSYIKISGGHDMMPYAIGLGCALSGVIALFCAAGRQIKINNIHAAATAVFFFNQIANIAGKIASGPASLSHLMIDLCYQAIHPSLKDKI